VSRRWVIASLVLLLLGATLGTALDGIHTHTGTTAYPHPWWFRSAPWVPPLFAAAALSIGLARPLWERWLGRASALPSLPSTLGATGLFICAYFLSGLLPGGALVRGLVLILIAAAIWWSCDRTRLGVGLALGTAVIGTTVESGLVHAGAFSYLHPDYAGVAGWLPCLYLCAQPAVGAMGKRLVERGAAR